MTEEINISYRLTESEFMRACEASWHAQGLGSKSNGILGALGLATGAGMWFRTAHWITLVGAILSCGFLALIGMRQLLWRKSFREARKYRDTSVRFLPQGLHIEMKEGVSDVKWELFSWHLETPEFILLYTTKRSFFVIPRSAFKHPSDEETVRQLVGEKLPMI